MRRFQREHGPAIVAVDVRRDVLGVNLDCLQGVVLSGRDGPFQVCMSDLCCDFADRLGQGGKQASSLQQACLSGVVIVLFSSRDATHSRSSLWVQAS